MYLIMSENWTITDPRDLRGLIDLARVVEDAGFTGVMMGEHVTMGPNSAYLGPPENPRDWIMAGNQTSDYPHPSGLHVLSAMAAVTTRLEILAGAVLSPLRHPLLLAKDLATMDVLSEGRFTFVPGVSWQREEYEALGVDFDSRGAILDEQLQVWRSLWEDGSPVTFHGKHYDFESMYIEPQGFRSGGPSLWIGGRSYAPWVKRRAIEFGKGMFTIKHPSVEEIADLHEGLRAAGRDPQEFQLGGFLFGAPFKGSDDLIDVDSALETLPDLVDRGIGTFVLKPSQFIADRSELGDFCRDVLSRVEKL